MLTGLMFVLAGLMILFYPQLLVLMISGVLILIGATVMLVSWQFRRLHKRSNSSVVNWIVRY